MALYHRLNKVTKKLGIDYEYIYVENGSSDNSQQIIRDLIKKDNHVRMLVYSRNFGPHGAYTGGLQFVTGDVVVCIDGDLQDPPELIETMIKKWKEGYKVVYGIRRKRKEGPMRKLGYLLYYRILHKLSYIPIPKDASDFALMDRKVVDIINAMPEHNKYIAALRAWVGFEQYGFEYERLARFGGKTKFNMMAYYRWAIQGFFSFSYKPLELISYLAFGTVFLTLLGIPVYFSMFFFYPDRPKGFITLILVMLFLGGVQLLCLSIIGQYIANIFEETKMRPHFIIKEVVGREARDQTNDQSKKAKLRH